MTVYKALPDHDLKAGEEAKNHIVVLVEPGESKNVGSVARLMGNFGFNTLRIVNAPLFNREEAAITACWAREVLEQACLYDSLPEALADCEDVVGFGAGYGRNRVSHRTIGEFLEESAVRPARRTALVFGPERTGLRNEHVTACRTLVRIPTVAANPSLNVAQAAGIVLYELSKVSWPLPDAAEEPAPPWEQYLYLEKRVQAVMQLSGFQESETPNDIARVVHSLFKRIGADRREMAILLGLFAKVEVCLQR